MWYYILFNDLKHNFCSTIHNNIMYIIMLPNYNKTGIQRCNLFAANLVGGELTYSPFIYFIQPSLDTKDSSGEQILRAYVTKEDQQPVS